MSWKKFRILVSLVSILTAGGCMNTPEPAECPNGLVCPPGSTCAADQDICIFDPCGNGIIDGHLGEMCDDGNIIAKDGCSADCKSDETCGNDVIDEGEVCDDGNLISGDDCSADCRSEICGDGILDAGEVCDDANQESGDGCSADCRSEICGNGILDAGEVCDDANQESGDGCSADCKSDETCGNGVIDAGEVCDDANQEAGDGCSADCKSDEACGNGVIDAGEVCDDANQESGDGCSEDCKSDETCGDGYVNDPTGEECDDAGDSVTCDANCTLASCGDGTVNPVAGELCDDGGESETCKADCTPVSCGDGIVNPDFNEVCDDGGDSATCDADCTPAECPDGYYNREAGEACDDGNSDNTDECTAACELASCTDGFQNADESDVDCGGHCGPSCEPLQTCSTNEDCAAGVCLGGTCVPDWGDLATGAHHTCALLDSGDVLCWGAGEHGRLGYGNIKNIGDNETPASARSVDVDGNVIQLVAGGTHTCALLDSGAVRCWGNGALGRLGYGNQNNIGDNEKPSSTNTVNVGGRVIQLTAGHEHTCALLDSGDVRCWGNGAHGRLGYGNVNNIGDNETPASAGNVNVGGNVIQLAAGGAHTCALLDSGDVRCWGAGAHGRLGYGNVNNIGDNETPASAGNVNVGGNVIQLTASLEHTCALLDSGDVRCWGAGVDGRLGYGNTQNIGDTEAPVSAGNVDVGLSVTVIQITAGYRHTCALLDTNAVRCWGEGKYGQLGYGNVSNIGNNEAPASAGDVRIGGNVIQITAGGVHTCAVLDTGSVRCWGYAASGQLGYGNIRNIGDNEHPESAGDVSVGGPVLPSAGSLEHAWDLLDASNAGCWSDGVSGQLDHGTTASIANHETHASADHGDSVARSANTSSSLAAVRTRSAQRWAWTSLAP